jgi:hypothetical protein
MQKVVLFMAKNVFLSIKAKIVERKKSAIIIAIAIIVVAIVVPSIMYNSLAPKVNSKLYNQVVKIYDNSYDEVINQGDLVSMMYTQQKDIKNMFKQAKTKDERIYIAALYQTLDEMLNYGWNTARQEETSESNDIYKQATRDKAALDIKIKQMGKDLAQNNVWLVTKYTEDFTKNPLNKDMVIQ